MEDPPVDRPRIIRITTFGRHRSWLEMVQSEPDGVPYFVAELPGSEDPIRIERHIVSGSCSLDERQPERIGAVLVDDVQRVDGIADGLGHLPTGRIANQPVNNGVDERDVIHEAKPHLHHPGDPEIDDVEAGDEHRVRVEALQILGRVGPAKRGERPERRREPGIENILVLAKRRTPALRTRTGILSGHDCVIAIVAVPGGDPVAPPNLAAYAPVAQVLHPMEVVLLPPLRNESGAAVPDRLDRRSGEIPDAHEPLERQVRFDHRPAAVAMPNTVMVLLDTVEMPPLT